MPPLLAGIPLLTKALGFAKGLAGLKGATSVMSAGKLSPNLAAAASAFGKGQTARSTVARMAGPKLANAMSMMPQSAGELGTRVLPDALFGTLAGVMTPGDLGDKLIAGTTATVGGAAGGLVARGVVGGLAPKALTPMLGKHKNPAYNGMLDIGLEMGGGLTGDMAGQGVADALLRLKGGGTTPYEKMAAEQQKELEQQILRSYLSGKGGYPTNDYFLQENGLG